LRQTDGQTDGQNYYINSTPRTEFTNEYGRATIIQSVRRNKIADYKPVLFYQNTISPQKSKLSNINDSPHGHI